MPRRYHAVYILYPRGVQTGGPEALHQLGAALREIGTPAFLVPLANTISKSRVAEYEKYDVPEAKQIIDQPGNAVVAPEVCYLNLVKYRHVDRFCWWLSVDNSQLFESGRRRPGMQAESFEQHVRRVAHRIVFPFIRQFALRLPVHHLTQSAYAYDFLFSRAGLTSSMLSDYISFPTPTKGDAPPTRNERQIAFNFAKGGDLVQQVIESNTVDALWVPIKNMTHHDVIRTLQSSAIYLDLGHQPGKDRLPREAAASGAVTLVARRGAGASDIDFPLPYDHKIAADNTATKSASTALNAVLADLSHQYERQKTFRDVIELERQVFIRDVRQIFAGSQFDTNLSELRG